MPAVLLLAIVVGAGLGAAAKAPPTPAPARTAILVELFTSEGCSSCPPADAVLATLLRDQPVDGAEIVPLSLHVDYWNRLGWKDPFSAKAYSDRQQKYAKVFGEDKLYTPQIVVDGRDEINGADETGVKRFVATAAARPHLAVKATARPADRAVNVSIDLPAAPPGGEPIDVLIALTEDGLTTAVLRGENKGRTLPHVAVVRRLQTLGTLDREAYVADGRLALDSAWKPAKMRAVVWLQGRSSNHVYGAASVAWTPR